MRRNIYHVVMGLFVVLVFAALTGCGGDDGGETPVTAAGTEVWVGTNDQGNTTTTFTKSANGTITTTGQWIYNYQGAMVTCQISAGNMTMTGSNITITATGTATNPAAPAGYQTSPFTLSQSGTMSGGQGSGSFTITFQTTGWPSSISGNWTAQKQSGSGVTLSQQAVAGTYTGTFTTNAIMLEGSYGATLAFINDQSGTLTINNMLYSYYNSPFTVSSVNGSQVNLTFNDTDGDTIYAVLVREGNRLHGSWHYQNTAYTASGQIDVTRNP